MAIIPGNETDKDVIRRHLERTAPGFELQDVKVNTAHGARSMFMATSTTDTLKLQTAYDAGYNLVDFRLTSKDA